MGPKVLTSLLRVAAALTMAFGACGSMAKDGDDFDAMRERMVSRQIAGRGVTDPLVLKAMRRVPRHKFVPAAAVRDAYSDYPLSIGYEQTISQPYIVAYMTEALQLRQGQKILEIGTGSGYQAAVLAEIGADVYTVEIIEQLGQRARDLLSALGYRVHVRIGDGYLGWPEAAPFDGIVVTAAPAEIPEPLIAQLKEGGRLVIPVGRFIQDLKVLKKKGGKLTTEKTLPVRFVPMTGRASGS